MDGDVYSIHYFSGFPDGTGDRSSDVTFGQSWTTDSGSFFERSGYELIGWSTRGENVKKFGLNEVQPPYNREGDLLLYGVWRSLKDSMLYVKTQSGVKTGIVYVKHGTELKTGIIFVKGDDGKIHKPFIN